VTLKCILIALHLRSDYKASEQKRNRFMAHDGQDLGDGNTIILSDLLSLAGAAIAPVEAVLETAKNRLRTLVSTNGRVSASLVEQHQTATHGLAWLATYAQALRQMHKWADALNSDGKFGEVEQLILQITFGEYLWQIYGGIQMNQGEVLRLQDMGLDQDDMRMLMEPAVQTLTQHGNTQAARVRLVELMQEQSANITVGATGLDDELEMIREQFRRYAVEKVEPFAHEWHLKDELIPIDRKSVV
jgi:(2S)-methylsuccinyl-CoA dehydrogenase